MTPVQLEEIEASLRERAKPLGDSRRVDAIQLLAGDLAAVVAHIRETEVAPVTGTLKPGRYTLAAPGAGGVVETPSNGRGGAMDALQIVCVDRDVWKARAEERDSVIAAKDAEIARLRVSLGDLDATNKRAWAEVNKRDTRIADLEATVVQRNAELEASAWTASTQVNILNATIANMRPVVDAACAWSQAWNLADRKQALLDAVNDYQARSKPAAGVTPGGEVRLDEETARRLLDEGTVLRKQIEARYAPIHDFGTDHRGQPVVVKPLSGTSSPRSTEADGGAPVNHPATHRCKVCGALWWRGECPPVGLCWSLRSASCGKCCDNVPMREQIEPLPALAAKGGGA